MYKRRPAERYQVTSIEFINRSRSLNRDELERMRGGLIIL